MRARPGRVLVLLLLAWPATLWAGPAEREPARTLGAAAYPVAGAVVLLHLVSDSPARRETGRRAADAAVLSLAATALLKRTVPSARPAPYAEEVDGFPSGHTAVACAVATVLSRRDRGTGWVYFPLAAATAWSRRGAHRHDWGQILAGAALGIAVGHLSAEGKLRLSSHADDAVGTGPPPGLGLTASF